MAVQIAPSLLAADLSRLADEIHKLEKAGVDLLHLDIMDGKFVPNLTFGFPVIESIRKVTKLPLDAHLMIEDADKYLEEFQKAGCNWLSVHVEACSHLQRTVTRIRELGMKAGVAINPGTSLDHVEAILPFCDYILIMSVNPGYGGQKFIPGSFERVKKLKQMIGKLPVKIQIDGGIKDENIKEAVQSGVDIVVIGTGLLKAPDFSQAVATLRKLAS